jgi:predicted nucleic acid-binding protein
VAIADSVYADPSALLKLYLHERESRAMGVWRAKAAGALGVTHHGRIEIINGLGLAAQRGHISAAALADSLASMDEDFAEGRYQLADLLWRSALNRAAELSRTHTPILGTRTLDVLHVACALELGLRRFLTFDERQQRLARAVGLRLIAPVA